MASREDDFKAVMIASAPLLAVLTGGVFTLGATGPEGINRDTTAAAYDAGGYLKPCALIRQRGLVPDNQIVDGLAKIASAGQTVEIYLYQDRGYSAIDAARGLIYNSFQGVPFADTFPVEWSNTIDRQRDTGALAGASMARIDFFVRSIVGAT